MMVDDNDEKQVPNQSYAYLHSILLESSNDSDAPLITPEKFNPSLSLEEQKQHTTTLLLRVFSFYENNDEWEGHIPKQSGTHIACLLSTYYDHDESLRPNLDMDELITLFFYMYSPEFGAIIIKNTNEEGTNIDADLQFESDASMGRDTNKEETGTDNEPQPESNPYRNMDLHQFLELPWAEKNQALDTFDYSSVADFIIGYFVDKYYHAHYYIPELKKLDYDAIAKDAEKSNFSIPFFIINRLLVHSIFYIDASKKPDEITDHSDFYDKPDDSHLEPAQNSSFDLTKPPFEMEDDPESKETDDTHQNNKRTQNETEAFSFNFLGQDPATMFGLTAEEQDTQNTQPSSGKTIDWGFSATMFSSNTTPVRSSDKADMSDDDDNMDVANDDADNQETFSL